MTEGAQAPIETYLNSDHVEQVAMAFCLKYGLPPRAVEELAGHLDRFQDRGFERGQKEAYQ